MNRFVIDEDASSEFLKIFQLAESTIDDDDGTKKGLDQFIVTRNFA